MTSSVQYSPTLPKSTLFLHMGPGLNAGIERKLFSHKNPEVDYWDQPAVRGPHAYSDLLAETLRRVESLYASGSSPINLVAHSFGGILAAEVLRKIPEKVSSLTLLSTGHDLVKSFYLLLSRLASDSATPADLRKKMETHLRENPEPTLDPFWSTIGMIVEDPNFMRLYWPTDSHFTEHRKLAEKFPPLDFLTFEATLNSYLRIPSEIPKRISWDGPVTLILGDRDPLLTVGETTRYWRTLFPSLLSKVRPGSGHFVHLEDYILSS